MKKVIAIILIVFILGGVSWFIYKQLTSPNTKKAGAGSGGSSNSQAVQQKAVAEKIILENKGSFLSFRVSASFPSLFPGTDVFYVRPNGHLIKIQSDWVYKEFSSKILNKIAYADLTTASSYVIDSGFLPENELRQIISNLK